MRQIKKGDTVQVMTGKDRGQQGKVAKVLPKEDRALVEGIHEQIRHVRARRAGQKGQRIAVPGKVHLSNLKLVCSSCKQPVRVTIRREDKQAQRVCKRCDATIS